MNYLINTLLFIVVGVSLTTADVLVTTWQYWVIMVSVIGIAINAMMW